MPLVPAICTQCGANIEVDNTHEAGICKFCGTAFITEKAINNYTNYVTNNIVNNNNFKGAFVTINNSSDNIDGLLVLAKRELQAKYYGSNDLFKYLDEIVGKSTDGLEKIRELFCEMGLYKIAKSAIDNNERIDKSTAIADLLTKYDSENIIGWLLYWRFFVKFVEYGENVIRLAEQSDKAKYEKEVYTYFVEHGPQCDAYKKYLGAVPKEYINNNIYIQDLIIKMASTIYRQSKETEKDVIQYLTNMLPENRKQEIVRETPKNNQSGGCYVATCVYGSYDCPEVWTLRRFRDYTLDATWYGRLFIKCYYATSPTLVKWFGNQKWFKTIWKKPLDAMVSKLNSNGVENTQYTDKY